MEGTRNQSVWSKIADPAWRDDLLSKLDKIPDFHTLANRSRSDGPVVRRALVPRMAAQARAILDEYDWEELRAARHYYNTQHLLAFWKHLHSLIVAAVENKFVSPELPLVRIAGESTEDRLIVNHYSMTDLVDGVFYRNADKGFDYSRRKPGPGNEGFRGTREEAFVSMEGRLSWVAYLAIDSYTQIYNAFIAGQYHRQTEIWKQYLVHVFLDNFLYFPDGTDSGCSRFDLVFFTNNEKELLVYLRSRFDKGNRLTITDVADFLERQSLYHLKLSQLITLEENDIRGVHKKLLYYDEDSGIVRMQYPEELIEQSRKVIRDRLNLKELGCPFGRAKGAEHNALLEVYRYFDLLFAAVLGRSWEFRYLFQG
jgi:hypothetical protein